MKLVRSFSLLAVFVAGALPLWSGVINKDGRVPLERGTFAANSTALVVNAGASCSATLLSKRLAISNRHCFVNDKTHQFVANLSGIVNTLGTNHYSIFKPKDKIGPALVVGMFDMHPTDLFEIREIWLSDSPEADYAVLRLDSSASDHKYPGEKFETFQVAITQKITPQISLDHAGYSEDFYVPKGTGHYQSGCQFLGWDGPIVKHNCSNSKGASGGPIWISQTHQLVAVNSGQVCPSGWDLDQDCAAVSLYNLAVPVSLFSSLVERLISEGN